MSTYKHDAGDKPKTSAMLMDTTEVAELLGVSVRQVYRLSESAKIR